LPGGRAGCRPLPNAEPATCQSVLDHVLSKYAYADAATTQKQNPDLVSPSTPLPIAPPIAPLVRRRPSRVFRAVTAVRIVPHKAVARIGGNSADGTSELQTRGTSPIRCVAHRQARQELDVVVAWGIDPRISGIRGGPRDGRCGRVCRCGGYRIGTTRNEDATQPVAVSGVTVRAG
jgi:hypothetical protein